MARQMGEVLLVKLGGSCCFWGTVPSLLSGVLNLSNLKEKEEKKIPKTVK